MSIKILLADDSITIQKVVGIIFGGDEYSLTIVDNGKAAVEKAREICPDVLLIDALMPGMNGYEVCQAVRATPAIATKPILILTGSFEPFDENKAKESGADDFLAKPFESQHIVSKVKELAEIGASRSVTPAIAPVAPAVVPEPTQGFTTETESPFAVAPSLEPSPAIATPQAPPVQPSDIWGAFTTDEPELQPQPEVTPALQIDDSASFAPSLEPDVFAMVNEEPDVAFSETTVQETSHPQHTGSQWIPVEEQTFEFVEESVADIPPAAFTTQAATVQEIAFGEIAFEEEEPIVAAPTAVEAPSTTLFETPAPVFAATPTFESTPTFEVAPALESPVSAAFETPVAPATPFAPLADPLPAFTAPVEPAPAVVAPSPNAAIIAPTTMGVAAPVALTEEQLKTALTGMSKEIIERIVWEVVPDLAEALIKDAIRKIKDGL